ncbi:hypothetical protein NP233_g5767 [Leucocoprinus birnbaumii]|uniref:Cytochrome P450 n=1 Tax=Leucocoprinus birnbaumii TaxID=56174 RepID=A0AAD5VS78_9AGAR|nr:hypothetical protein NP233_g5767 [Leucocoprinus birnbaumii]
MASGWKRFDDALDIYSRILQGPWEAPRFGSMMLLCPELTSDMTGTKMVYLELFGKPIIIINDIKTAQELLEKRAGIYSSRRQIRMLTEVIGFKALFGLMPYGDEWRTHRRMFRQHFSDRNLPKIQERILEFLRKSLLPNILTSPEDIHGHVRDFIGGLSSSLTYGLPTQRQNDPLVRFAEQGWLVINHSGAPGRYLVNLLSPLKYVPEWMPGSRFKQEAKEMRKTLDRLMEDPYQATVKAMESKAGRKTSFVQETLERLRDKPDFETQARYVKQTACQIFGGLSETTATATMTFILAMVIRPDVQRKAQEEVDSVVGDRLPEFADMPQLLYLSAVIKEALRWNPATPLGVPHMTSDQDVYMGYYIPKNCTVIANAYSMLHDEDFYSDADEFKPERFITNDGHLRQDIPDPELVATFGFGRRVCPGSHVARSMLYITAATILSLFDISSGVDPDGKPVEVTPRFAPASLVSYV